MENVEGIGLKKVLYTYGKSINNRGKVFLNEGSIEFILNQIHKFKKKGEWEVVK